MQYHVYKEALRMKIKQGKGCTPPRLDFVPERAKM